MKQAHDRLDGLLPWYVNGSLNAAEAAEIREHAASCVTCRGQLRDLQEIREEVESVPGPGLDPEQGFAAMRRRLGAREQGEDRTGFLQRMGSGPLRWLVVAQAAALALLVGLLLDRQAAEVAERADFRTLADTAPSTAATLGLKLLFNGDTTEEEIRTLLHRIGGRIVDGPSPLGVYVVELRDGGDSGRPGPSEVRIDELRGHPAVRFAEWVGAAPDSARPRSNSE